MEQSAADGGGRRRRKTSSSVVWADRVSHAVITVGGVSVLGCVLGIVVYLAAVVLPLFRSTELEPRVAFRFDGEDVPLALVIDEHRTAGMAMSVSGELIVFELESGAEVARTSLFDTSAPVTAFRRNAAGAVAAGFADGAVRLGELEFETVFVGPDEVGTAADALAPGESTVFADGVLQRTVKGDLRLVRARARFDRPVAMSDVAIEAIDYRTVDELEQLAVIDARARFLVSEVSLREDFMTGEVVREIEQREVASAGVLEALGPPVHLRLLTGGRVAYLVWRDGVLLRYDLSDPTQARLLERTDVVISPEADLSALEVLPGGQSLLIGDSAGGLNVWFGVPVSSLVAGVSPASLDGRVLTPIHQLSGAGAAVSALAVSARDRSVLAGRADGSLELYHATSARDLASARLEPADAVALAGIAEKGDGVFALTGDGALSSLDLDNPHPETTLSSLFGRVWYEGYEGPAHIWQSSGASDDVEPKLGMVPLIFGTLKATLYSMLFAAPIALLAAIYTSEFMDRRLRAPLKSTVELMASLPSVVLGFIAALVLAPLVESWVLAVMTAAIAIPIAAIGFGFATQLLPVNWSIRLAGPPQLVLSALLVALVIAVVPWAAGLVEAALFGGDFRSWLDLRQGGAAPGLFLLLFPVLAAFTLLIDTRLVAPAIGRRERTMPRRHAAWLAMARFAGMVVVAAVAAAALALLGAASGLDARDSLFGTYVQRNALVVGFAMGFAVIPIIYTIADDALTAVPRTLRSASLGCGATRWQTAVRVVLPVAFPGIFSALMIGLGRAVGETMIVLMAAGNTPIMELNLFSGMRTLAANIAVELPEAAKDGSLFRVLFLSALTLFAITFVVNTIAEIVRQRYRRRAVQL